jgi:SAM-dependent MidA family methyltransferase
MHFPEPVSHEAFMQRALYDPDAGYYATQAMVGRAGDFSTSATLSPDFAEAVANWVMATADRLQLPGPCPVFELGPGSGALIRNLAEHLPGHPFHLIETSAKLREIQSERLAGTRFQHHESLRSALRQTDGIGILIANEFVDAFPAVKLRWHNDDWFEVGVRYNNGLAEEILAPLERDIDADAPANPREGETIYVHPSFHHWMSENIPVLKQGALLLIDYGAERPARECRAYSGQERFEGMGIYKEPGSRDITCDINFTDLIRWGQGLGLKCFSKVFADSNSPPVPRSGIGGVPGLSAEASAKEEGRGGYPFPQRPLRNSIQASPVTLQTDFLKTHLPDFEARRASEEALGFLADPFGAGAAFKALVLET